MMSDTMKLQCELDHKTQELAEQAEQITTKTQEINRIVNEVELLQKDNSEQAEQIGAMHTTIKCMADTLRERDEQLKTNQDSFIEQGGALAAKVEQQAEEIKELLLANTKNTEICQKYEAELIQANLDIINQSKQSKAKQSKAKQYGGVYIARIHKECARFPLSLTTTGLKRMFNRRFCLLY